MLTEDDKRFLGEQAYLVVHVSKYFSEYSEAYEAARYAIGKNTPLLLVIDTRFWRYNANYNTATRTINKLTSGAIICGAMKYRGSDRNRNNERAFFKNLSLKLSQEPQKIDSSDFFKFEKESRAITLLPSMVDLLQKNPRAPDASLQIDRRRRRP